MIKLKHIKLEKPDKQEHYPSKGEGTPATAQSKERVKGPPHPRPKQDDANRNYWYLQIKMYNGKKSGLPDTKTKKKDMGKVGNVSPNQCSHTKPLRVKGEKDTTSRDEYTCIIIIQPYTPYNKRVN